MSFAPALVGLRALAEALPTGTAVPVPREILLELLQGGEPAASPVRSAADLTVAELAVRFGRKPSTVRGWLDRGLIAGAYRFQRREWRVPAASLESFEHQQRTGRRAEPIRSTRGKPVDLGAWRKQSRRNVL